uniref:N-acetyltransferase domain-containing protein n=1 Tax=viral metagenome TaxID=1070528 RepID=A0A6C0EI35_9ZZZZ
MYRHLLKKTKQNYKLSLICNQTLDKIGTLLFTSKLETGYLINIKIDNNFKKLGYGSILIKNAETILIEKYNINTIRLSAWENSYVSNNLIGFYEQNGYNVTDIKNISYYDNGYDIFNIVPMVMSQWLNRYVPMVKQICPNG